ncbi:sec-independent protein translocase protein TATB, chloroplastic [Lactuca sativa]|uniref:Sec-independent protein translocase protein TATB, chloroplastic n=1 Tax=Lactuca sativa TaxID=4236 RepID=A0A9R1UI73_LACSA|nr:sec-independent protein translocase protein TATB, chloroplastic [Lactuca sativa]KAJ0187542.1 hypothetical protein LSAT_V11C900479510 [Lactuca sativa]
MASAIFNPPYLSHPSSSSSISPKFFRKPPIYASLSPTVRSLTWVPHIGSTPFSSWNGLRTNGLSISLQSLKLEKRKKCKGKGVFASLFGVGAPEALVIGVVALLVFGPKGLAEVAKTLGKTLRSFQPTIRELQEVSREFKSTLEKEIGLDELKNPLQGNYTSTTQTQIPPDTLQNSQLTATPPATTNTTDDDSPATTTTPEDPQATATTTPDVSLEDSGDTTATPAVTMEEDSQPTVDTTNGSPSSRVYTSEELLKITEEQLKAVASQQQKEEPPVKPESEM